MTKLAIAIFAVVTLLFAVITLPSSIATQTVQAMQKATSTPLPLRCNQVIPFIQRAGAACAAVGRDQICYGSHSVDVEFAEGTSVDTTSFIKPGDTAALTAFNSISTTRLNLEERELGIAMFKLQARVPGATAGQAVTFVLFGDSSLGAAPAEEVAESDATQEAGQDKVATFPGSGAFYFTTTIGAEATCKDVAHNGLAVQSPRGTKVNFSMNGAKITIGSTVLFQNQNNQSLLLSVLEGQAEVEADGVTQLVKAGFQLTIPLESEPEPTQEATEESTSTAGTAGAPSAPRVIPRNVQLVNCGLVRSLGIRTACIVLGNAAPGTPRPTRTPRTSTVQATPTLPDTTGATTVPPTTDPATMQCFVDYFTASPNPVPPNAKGEFCTTMSWGVGGVKAVYLDGAGVVGYGSTTVCLKRGETQRHTLSLECANGEKKGASLSISTAK